MSTVTQPSLFEGKSCVKCQEWKQLSAFSRDKDKKDGLRRICRECDKAKVAAYRAIHPEMTKAANRKYRIENPEAVKQQQREWSAKNPEKRSGYMSRWYLKNTDKVRKNVERWRAENPDLDREIRHRRRARIAGNGGRYTVAEWKELCELYGNKCLKCGSIEPLTVDHVIPISKGGSNNIENLQPLCMTCNATKNARIIDYRTKT